MKAWLESRIPPAPAELTAHLLGFVGDRDASAHAHTLLQAGDQALARVLDAGAANRDSALDLLSADAFVTYAFEAAADEPVSIASRANDAMRQVSDRAVTYLDRIDS